MLVDTHAHLNLDPLYERWPAVLKDALEAGVERLIVPSADNDSSDRSVSISANEPLVFSAVGIHPETLLASTDYDLTHIETLLSHKKVVGIGEIGLDYFREHAPIEIQRALFRDQLSLARNHSLPVIIHSRTDEAMMNAVEDIRSVYGKQQFRGVFHCFSGSIGFYETVSALGAMIGVGGMITYDHQLPLQQVVSTIPLKSIILETDAPWLMPQPKPRGVNSPANVTIVAVKLAALLQEKLSNILEITGENALTLFPQMRITV